MRMYSDGVGGGCNGEESSAGDVSFHGLERRSSAAAGEIGLESVTILYLNRSASCYVSTRYFRQI